MCRFRTIADISPARIMVAVSAPSSDKSRSLVGRDYALMFAMALPVWFFFVHRGDSVRGFVGALAVCAVGVVGAILSKYSNRRAYWVALIAIALIHLMLVLLLPLPKDYHGPGIVFAPLVIADMYGCAKLVLFVLKRCS
jgi:predicted permease